MSTVTEKRNYIEILGSFARNTKVDYEKGDPFINSVFREFDKDLNGEFNDEEWNNYTRVVSQHQEIRNFLSQVSPTSKYYSEKLVNLSEELCKLEAEAAKLEDGAFQELLDFEKAHPEISRNGYSDKKDVPKNAYLVDIEPFGMGIYDEKTDCFTGQCYKKGYIEGLEKLSEEDREKYLQLLQKALDTAKKYEKLSADYTSLIEKYEKYWKVSSFVDAGYVSSVVSDETAQKLCEIYDAANPFSSKIKEIETELARLKMKGKPTDEEKRRIIQYNAQLEQLKKASSSWSIKDADETIITDQLKDTFNCEVSPINITLEDSKLTNTSKLNLKYTDMMNWGLGVDFSNTLSVDPKMNVEHTYVAGMQVGYGRDNFAIGSNTIYNKQKEMSTFDQKFKFNYRKFSVTIGEEIITASKQENVTNENPVISTMNGSKLQNALYKYYLPTENVEEICPKITSETSYTSIANIKYNNKNLTVNVEGSVTPNKKEKILNESGELVERKFTAYSANANLGYNIENFQNSLRCTFDNTGNNFELSSNGNIEQKYGKHMTATYAPSASVSYNDGVNAFTINPNIDVQLSYKKEDLGLNLGITEQYSLITSNGSKPIHNNNFTTTGNIIYKDYFSTSIKFNDTDAPYSHSNVYGLEVGYQSKKYGNFGLEYSHQKETSKSDKSVNNTNSLTVKYSLTF